MAGSRGPASRQRRHHDSRESRQGQWLVLGVAGSLVAVALIIVAGLVWSVYLPPREHALTVGSADFNAGQVADRAVYLVTAGNGNASRDPAGEGSASLTRQQILLEFGAGLVAPVTDDDVRLAIATRLGALVEPTPEPTVSPTPDAATPDAATPTATPATTATPEATGTPAATETPQPEVDEGAYAEAYADFLRVAPIKRGDFESIIRAGIIEERLIELFQSELPDTGDQLLISAVSTNDRTQAQALIDAVAAGQTFAEAAVSAGIVDAADDLAAAVWFSPEGLDDRLRPAIEALQAGQVSEIVNDANQIGFEVYYVEDRTTTEPYDEAVVTQLALLRLDEFIEQWSTTDGVVKDDLSSDERTWIARRVQEELSQ